MRVLINWSLESWYFLQQLHDVYKYFPIYLVFFMLTIFLSLIEILLPLFINIFSMCLYFHHGHPWALLGKWNSDGLKNFFFFLEKATFRLFVSCKWKYEYHFSYIRVLIFKPLCIIFMETITMQGYSSSKQCLIDSFKCMLLINYSLSWYNFNISVPKYGNDI